MSWTVAIALPCWLFLAARICFCNLVSLKRCTFDGSLWISLHLIICSNWLKWDSCQKPKGAWMATYFARSTGSWGLGCVILLWQFEAGQIYVKGVTSWDKSIDLHGTWTCVCVLLQLPWHMRQSASRLAWDNLVVIPATLSCSSWLSLSGGSSLASFSAAVFSPWFYRLEALTRKLRFLPHIHYFGFLRHSLAVFSASSRAGKDRGSNSRYARVYQRNQNGKAACLPNDPKEMTDG